MKRRPFFLLEVLIAAILIGLFAFLSIHGAFRMIGKQKKQLEAIEAAMQADKNRMEAIAAWWKNVESYPSGKTTAVEHNCKITWKYIPNTKCCLLTVKNKQSDTEKCHYVINR